MQKPNPLRSLPQAFYDKIESIAEAHEEKLLTADDILFLSNLEIAAKDKDITKLLAIPLDEYNWLSEAHCRDITYTLNTLPDHAKIAGRGIIFEAMKFRKFLNITYGGGPTRPEKKGRHHRRRSHGHGPATRPAENRVGN